MTNYMIKVEYDGIRYKGWQVQKSTKDTIQGKLQSILESMCGHEVMVIGSGRTDAGVHAKGQVANFHMEDEYSMEYIFEYINKYLPQDIAVTHIQKVNERFHSRYNAISKTYMYRIHTGNVSNVFERKYVYDYDMELDVDKMKKAAKYLIGTHNFKAFCGNKKMKKSTVRTIYSIEIVKLPGEIQIKYKGDGFLQNMIRIMTGTLIEIGDGRRNPEEIVEILESKERSQAG